MNSLARVILGAALCASAFSAAAAPVNYSERRGAAAESARVIVEFHGTPAAIATRELQTAQHAQLFARFRADLTAGRISTHAAGGPAPRIAHEYRTVFLGAAIEADDDTVSRIGALPYVRAVHPDRMMHASASPAVAPLSTIVDARTKVNASSLGTGGAGVVVAVIDTGIDYTHPSLGGGLGAGFKVVAGRDFINEDDDPMDDNGHGTHVAATIAGSAPDLIGVAPDVTLIGYKVLAAGGSGPTSGIIAAIERCADPNGDGNFADRVDVANLSLGGPGDADDPASRAVDNAVAAGVVMVVAAGNDGTTASIGSPGTASSALTVAAIDDTGRVTDFSSRGPSPRLLGFKPDVSAPGFQIVSARVGGGTVALNGTSMATPHVAGVAALLRKLHPSWSPAEVKAAITSSATAVTASPFARGAGRVDARAAHDAKLLVGSSGLSFGIRPSRIGDTKETQTFRLTNHSGSAQTLNIAAGTAPAGVIVRVTPATLQLAAGATGEVSVEVETANATVAFPSDAMLGGEIRVTGSATATIPWAFLRTGRVRMTYDGVASLFLAIGENGAQGNPIRDPYSSEVFLTPGQRFDFLLVGHDAKNATQRVIVRPGVQIDGDHLLDIRESEAALELIFDGRDETGRSLSARSAAAAHAVHLVGTRVLNGTGPGAYSIHLADFRSRVRRLLFSPLPERYHLYNYEQLIDFDAAETYTVEHLPRRGLSETQTLTGGGAELMKATVQWRTAPAASTMVVCAYDALTTALNMSFGSCFGGAAPAQRSFVHHVTNERAAYAHNGMVFNVAGVETQALRGRDGRIVMSSAVTLPLTVERITPGGTLTLGTGPVYPFAIPGTRVAQWFRVPPAGFATATGELVTGGTGMEWTTFDASGNTTASGSWRGQQGGQAPPAPQAQSKLMARRYDLPTAAGMTRGTLEVTFGTTTDLEAPTLTSLRVVDAAGNTSDRLRAGEHALLQFSVADLNYAHAAEALPTRPEATRAWFRIAGTDAWQPLALSITGSETGDLNAIGHVPAGDLYSASLDAATASGNARIDIRIEFADPAGNSVRWTHESAITVGNPAAPSQRRRSVRN